MIPKKSLDEIKVMRTGGRILAGILQKIALAVAVGVTTEALNDLAEELIIKAGGSPSFKGYAPVQEGLAYPKALCCSINNEVVHGIPSPARHLKSGDIISLDLGFCYQGWHTDSALTVTVGRVAKNAEQLIKVTKEALHKGIEQVKPRATIGDIGAAIQEYVEKNGYSVVKNLVGHGIGQKLHELPRIPNFGQRGAGAEIKVGHVLAIEPMVNIGNEGVETKNDGWTVITADGSLSAHFEHTVAVIEKGYQILTLPE